MLNQKKSCLKLVSVLSIHALTAAFQCCFYTSCCLEAENTIWRFTQRLKKWISVSLLMYFVPRISAVNAPVSTYMFSAGIYECGFMSGSVRHTAKAQLRVALLPDVIQVEIKPPTADCSSKREGESFSVNIYATISNSTDSFEVWWSYMGGEQSKLSNKCKWSISHNLSSISSCKHCMKKKSQYSCKIYAKLKNLTLTLIFIFFDQLKKRAWSMILKFLSSVKSKKKMMHHMLVSLLRTQRARKKLQKWTSQFFMVREPC